MRDPDAPGWPDHGERTELEEVASRWAWEYLALVKGEHRRRVLGLGKAPKKLGEAVKGFLEHRAVTVERGTLTASRTSVAHLLEHFGRSVRTDALNAPALQELVRDLLEKGYQPTTVALYARGWRVFLEWCHFGLCGQALRTQSGSMRRYREFLDHVGDLEIPNPGKADVVTLDDAEIPRLFDAARKVDAQQTGYFPSAVLSCGIGLYMGLRMGEIFALSWQDIRPAEKTVRVQWQVPKDLTTLKPLKGKLARTVLILPGWWEHHRSDAVGFICGRTGQPVGTRTQRNLITRVLDTAGLNGMGLGWHLLRHTYARLFVESGGRIEELQKSLGHTSIVTTETAYGHYHENVAARNARQRIYGA